MTRFVLTAGFMLVCASTAAAADRPSATPGCPAAVQGGPAHLTLSAKASTPVASSRSNALAPRHQTTASNSPKSSTPIGETTLPSGRRTAGAVTPKGSIPVWTALGCPQ